MHSFTEIQKRITILRSLESDGFFSCVFFLRNLPNKRQFSKGGDFNVMSFKVASFKKPQEGKCQGLKGGSIFTSLSYVRCLKLFR